MKSILAGNLNSGLSYLITCLNSERSEHFFETEYLLLEAPIRSKTNNWDVTTSNPKQSTLVKNISKLNGT